MNVIVKDKNGKFYKASIKTTSDLKKHTPLAYEEFIRQKIKYGVTFAQFMKSLKAR